MKKDFSRTFFRYVFEFTTAGFVGWIYEVATVWVMYRYFDNRGMLHLPIIPIYSVGAFILLALLRKKRHPVFIFFFAMVITTLFELGASYLLEFIFHKEFWTYENWYFSILDRPYIKRYIRTPCSCVLLCAPPSFGEAEPKASKVGVHRRRSCIIGGFYN